MNLSITHALAWIVASTLVVSGGTFSTIKYIRKAKLAKILDPSRHIQTIVHSGPSKNALSPAYLAEILNLSIDRPMAFDLFHPDEAKDKLEKSPVIKEAVVAKIEPDAIYVDYSVRDPIAFLGNYSNLVLDEERVPFPLSPFYSPKCLPEIILPEDPTIMFGKPIEATGLDLAFFLLDLLNEAKLDVAHIDVSNAYCTSYGKREIIVIIDDKYTHTLRLSVKNFQEELGNYLVLQKTLSSGNKVIDFRLAELAFIEDQKD